MGRRGSMMENEVIDNWHAALEFERCQLEDDDTRGQARAGVAVFIDDYNRGERGSALGMMSPAASQATLADGPEAVRPAVPPRARPRPRRGQG